MAFDKKKQDIFNVYVDIIRKKGSTFDFLKSAKSFDRFLDRKDLKMDSAQYFRELWDELADPRSRWDFEEDDLKTFLGVVPKDIMKRNFSLDTIKRIIKPVDQPKYEKMVSMKTKEEARADYVASLAKTLLTTAHVKDGKCVVRAFLGDLSAKVGLPKKIQSGSLYRDFYDALEQEIGKQRTSQAIADVIVPEVTFEVTDWPNMANIDDSQYEIEFYFEPDELLLEELANATEAAVSKLF